MRNNLLSSLALLLLFALSTHALGTVPGDLDGDNIVSQDELQKAEELLKDGKIMSGQLEEIKHIKENYPRTLVDSANRTITIYKPIERIIAFGGYDAEIISLLGDKDKIVGVANWFKNSDFHRLCFSSLIEMPSPGTASSPDCEAILKLNPDVIICWESNAEKLAEQLPDNTTVVGMNFFHPETFIDESEKIAYILEKEGALDDYIDGFYSKYMNFIADRTKGLPEEKRPNVYWERQEPYQTFGKKEYITTLIEMCGGKNIFADDDFEITIVDAESVVQNNPVIIIRYAASKGPETGYSVDDIAGAKALRDEIMLRQELSQVDAVKNDSVYILNMGLPLGIQGPIGAAYAAKIIQPDLFKDLDPQAITEVLLGQYLGVEYDAKKHGVFVYPPEAV
ncbi:ABC transporter substrate-binding protein [Methanothrix sp.]|uniref:ABC transporter substrate-binding protein n=1 Tax=Methanothrix sp. TaxID=90426 RepID=UPI003BB7E267